MPRFSEFQPEFAPFGMPFGTDLGTQVNGSGDWRDSLLHPSRSPWLNHPYPSRTPMRMLLKKYRPTCEHVAFLPVGSTGSRASTTIAHSPTSHRTDGASFCST